MRVYNFPSDEIHIKNNKGEELAKIGPDGVEIDGSSDTYIIEATTNDLQTFTCEEPYSKVQELLNTYPQVLLRLTVSMGEESSSIVLEHNIESRFTKTVINSDSSTNTVEFFQYKAIFSEDNSKTLSISSAYWPATIQQGD